MGAMRQDKVIFAIMRTMQQFALICVVNNENYNKKTYKLF